VRERALILIGGPEGAGKTTFIETVLAATGGFVLAARCVRDETLEGARESAPKADPELRRYLEAGASGAARFAFPGSDAGTDAFFMTHLMEDYSEAVLLEGDNPLGFVDLSVFIAPEPRPRESLFVRRKRERAREERAKADDMERMLRTPDGVAELLGQMLGAPIVELARRNPRLLEDTRGKLLAGIAASRKALPPKATEHWAIGERFAGIEHAQLVVVNVRGERERKNGEEIVANLARLRKDETLFNDILGFRGSKIPVTAVVANLTDARDAGRKKAIARVRRALQARSR
jgi:hypothetical protein